MEFDNSADTVIEDIEYVSQNSQQPQQSRYKGAIPKGSSHSALLSFKAEHLPKNFQAVVDEINKGYKVCVILRGLPGSGKSYLSDQIMRQTVKFNSDEHILSADKFFMTPRGVYKFEADRLPLAHDHAQRMFMQKASQGLSPLIVDNTNLQYWEMDPYMKAANQFGYKIHIMEPETPWKFSEQMLSKKTLHGVPFDKIKLMKMRYETGCTIDQHLTSLGQIPVKTPQMRSHPPIVDPSSTSSDFIDFNTDISKLKLNDGEQTKSSGFTSAPSQSTNLNFQWKPPNPIFRDSWDVFDAPKKEEPKKAEPQPQKKQQKKTKSPDPTKMLPHRKGCKNENVSFREIREMYSQVNDAYLWDFFVNCKGAADWCVNLLCDENLTDQMDAGETLTCKCDDVGGGSSPDDERNRLLEELRQEQIQLTSPSTKNKKLKVKDDDEWMQAKNAIERSIFIGREHYPEHVNEVKTWKHMEDEAEDQLDSPVEPADSPLNESDGLYAFPVTRPMMIELDKTFGGGQMTGFLKSQKKLRNKIFIKKSTAMDLYVEIMQYLLNQDEEMKSERAKNDEELALKLNAEEQSKKFSPNHVMAVSAETFFGKPLLPNEWGNGNDEESDDIAAKMSRDKLIELFPQLNKNDLLEIFSGTNNNFTETVALITDSLVCTKDERQEIDRRIKSINNTPWTVVGNNRRSTPVKETHDANTADQLCKVEELRQIIQDAQDECRVLRQKANDAIRLRQFEVGTYYNNIAVFQKQRKDEAEHEVANLICGIHENTQKSSTTIDLHYHSLLEASMLLDTFIDKNIDRLRSLKKPREEIFVITGKGNNSKNGIPTIKNKSKSRCIERNLNCTELDNNPGVLKIKILFNSPLSNEL